MALTWEIGEPYDVETVCRAGRSVIRPAVYQAGNPELSGRDDTVITTMPCCLAVYRMKAARLPSSDTRDLWPAYCSQCDAGWHLSAVQGEGESMRRDLYGVRWLFVGWEDWPRT